MYLLSEESISIERVYYGEKSTNKLAIGEVKQVRTVIKYNDELLYSDIHTAELEISKPIIDFLNINFQNNQIKSESVIDSTVGKIPSEKAIYLLQEQEIQHSKPCPRKGFCKVHTDCKQCAYKGLEVHLKIAQARYKRLVGLPLSRKEKRLLLIFQEPIDCNKKHRNFHP